YQQLMINCCLTLAESETRLPAHWSRESQQDGTVPADLSAPFTGVAAERSRPAVGGGWWASAALQVLAAQEPPRRQQQRDPRHRKRRAANPDPIVVVHAIVETGGQPAGAAAYRAVRPVRR